MNASDGHVLAGVPPRPFAPAQGRGAGLHVVVTGSDHADAADVVRATHGDSAAFERLYHRHRERVHRLARRIVGSDDADDATQEIFFRAWTTLASYRADAAFSTWLHRLAINVLLRRGQRIRGQAARMSEITPDAIPAPQSSDDARLDIDRALATLPFELRAPVVLHDIEGYSHEEIGDMLNISLSAARMRLYRARQALRAFANLR